MRAKDPLDAESQNCVAWAYNIRDQRSLPPGWWGATHKRSELRPVALESSARNPKGLIQLLELDGCHRLSVRSFLRFERPQGLGAGWLVAAYWRRGGFHLRRLDVDGTWSEKQGGHLPERLGKLSAPGLLLARDKDGDRYVLVGLLWWQP